MLARINIARRLTSFTNILKSHHRYLTDAQPETKFTRIYDKISGSSRDIAYMKYEGFGKGKVVYIPGFMSDKSGNKATAFDSLCRKYGLTYIRYDPTGLGDSRPIPLSEARFSHWIEDAERIMSITEGPQTVIASSMGGWIALCLCLQYPEKFSGLVLIAPGINFVQRYRARISELFPQSVIDKLERGETVGLQYADYGAFPISYDLLDDMIEYELDLSQKLNIMCPVRIVHGLKDDDVPYSESLTLLQSLRLNDVQLTYIKDGDHKLSREKDLQLLSNIVLSLATK